MAVRAVIFDLDDTLVEEERTAHSSFHEVARRLSARSPERSGPVLREAVRDVWRGGPQYDLCVDLGIASWEGLWATFEGNHAVLDGVKAWVPAFRHQAWNAALAAVGLAGPDAVQLAQDTFAASQTRGHPLIDGAAQAVDRLGEQAQLGLLTNGPSDIQRQKLRGAGLLSRFGALAISGETGVGKPAPTAFTEVVARLGAEPREAVMVGDNWDRDVRGAVSCGLSAVWIASGRAAPEHLDGVTVVDTIRELPHVLG